VQCLKATVTEGWCLEQLTAFSFCAGRCPKTDQSTDMCRNTSKGLVAWHSGNVVGRINEVNLHRARLVLGWVTVFGGQTTSVSHQATQANSASYPQLVRL